MCRGDPVPGHPLPNIWGRSPRWLNTDVTSSMAVVSMYVDRFITLSPPGFIYGMKSRNSVYVNSPPQTPFSQPFYSFVSRW
jgi:hypothetical protein